MRHRLPSLARLAAILLVPAALPSQRAPLDTSAIDRLVADAMAQRRLPGASVALVRGGRIEMVRAYGAASLQPRVPADTGTRFAIGSVTKQFVAALALLLQEEGRLSVHDTLARWYPQLTRAREVTLLDLINHVSGYHDYYPLDFVDRAMARPTTADRIVQTFGTAPLDFDPGTRWSYSNTGYAILGRVLERAGGKPLGTMLEERIFRPLGMRQTVYEPASAERRATPYATWALGDPEPPTVEGPGWLGAAGGIWSTAANVARWDLALMRPGFLSPASRAVMFGERMLRDSTSTHYAGGLSVAENGGRTIYQHGGATMGFAASNTFIPADTAAVVVLVNGDQSFPSGMLVQLVSPPRPAATPTPAREPRRPPPPAVRGASAAEAAAELFAQLQRGQVDRTRLAAEYSAFLTPARVAAAARTLAPLGAATRTNVLDLGERGGFEVSVVQLVFPKRIVMALMYRSTDGAVEEFLLW